MKSDKINISYFYLGAVLEAEAFDTHGDESASENLNHYLNFITGEGATYKVLIHFYQATFFVTCSSF